MPNFELSIETAGKAGGLALGLFAVARLLVSWAKRLGLSDDYVASLHADLDSLRTRLGEAEAARRRSEDESLVLRGKVLALEADVHALRLELATLRAAWDLDRLR